MKLGQIFRFQKPCMTQSKQRGKARASLDREACVGVNVDPTCATWTWNLGSIRALSQANRFQPNFNITIHHLFGFIISTCHAIFFLPTKRKTTMI